MATSERMPTGRDKNPTVVGTSVAAFALLTYLRLGNQASQTYRNRSSKGYVRPSLTLLRDDLETEDTILSEIHVTFYEHTYQRRRPRG